MKNMEDNKDNAKYFVRVDGTANMTTIMGAPVVATKGHYIDFSDQPEFKDAKPLIFEKGTNKEVSQSVDDNEIILQVEPNSGVVLNGLQRLQINFFLESEGDKLYDFQSGAMMIPLVYVKKEGGLNAD